VSADQEKIVSDWARAHTPVARVDAFGEHLMFWERADRFNRGLVDFARSCRPRSDGSGKGADC
jgi:hypothetical protein